MARRRSHTALILGGASTLEADKHRALSLFAPDLVIACNHAARDEPGRVDHWATMHPELFPMWLEARRAAGRPDPGRLWHARHRLSQVDSTPIESWGGSSGLLCVALAFELECSRIVLAGVPMEKSLRHYDDPKPWQEARQYHPAWERHMARLRTRVRSLSGWTREQLGEPTGEWLNAQPT